MYLMKELNLEQKHNQYMTLNKKENYRYANSLKRQFTNKKVNMRKQIFYAF